MELIDTHCHISNLEQPRLLELFDRARSCSVNKLICVGSVEGTKSAFDSVALAAKYKNVWAAVGIHPHDAGSFTDLSPIEQLIDQPKVVAVGETGLDFFRDWAPRDKQFQLFRNSVAAAKKHKKKLIIHCRDANDETLSVLAQEGAAEVGGVFHCYAGDAKMAETLRSMNFLVSFTGNITFKKAAALRETVLGIPLEQMMLETDCPYMAPEPFRGQSSEPMHVYQVALKIAELKQISLEEVARVTTSTARRFFGLPQDD